MGSAGSRCARRRGRQRRVPSTREADVVVVGGGGGGLPAALFTRWLGDEVVLLEKAPELGGTANKAAFWYWVPNNEPMRAAASRTPRRTSCATCARLSRPERYDADSPTLGPHRVGARADHARSTTAPRPATELLAERGALPYRHCEAVPDYWSELPEDKAPTGRVLVPGRRPRVDVRRRAERHPHAERGGGARRRRHPHGPPRAAASSATADAVVGVEASDRGRADGPRRRAQGRRLRHRRLHPRRRAAHATSSPRRSSAAARRSPTRATSSASRGRSARSCAT